MSSTKWLQVCRIAAHYCAAHNAHHLGPGMSDTLYTTAGTSFQAIVESLLRRHIGLPTGECVMRTVSHGVTNTCCHCRDCPALIALSLAVLLERPSAHRQMSGPAAGC